MTSPRSESKASHGQAQTEGKPDKGKEKEIEGNQKEKRSKEKENKKKDSSAELWDKIEGLYNLLKEVLVPLLRKYSISAMERIVAFFELMTEKHLEKGNPSCFLCSLLAYYGTQH